jgi:ornithine cyclodeaminase/alanine dehydrogenase-like protein (mu-crystallin family)
LKIITEAQSAAVASASLAFDAVREAFIALADGSAVVNPVAGGAGTKEGSTFGVKSGSVPGLGIVGAKIGSYWPGNEAFGLPCHDSTVFLLDPQTGRIRYAVAASTLNGWRTAAANAVAASVLARQDSRTLSVIGAGHQAEFEVRSLCERMNFERVLIASRSTDRAEALVAEVKRHVSATVRASSAEEACRQADILVTVTPSRQPLFDAGWIRPGTHVAAMGTDRKGKQEIPVELLRKASLFADLPEQSRTIGEMQHVAADIDAGKLRITAIGDVLRGNAPGRRTDEEITLFDSSGVAIQDLFVAQRVVERLG